MYDPLRTVLPLVVAVGLVACVADPDPRERQLEEARAAWQADPDDAELTIWLGRRLAYLGRYDEAIEVYTRGLERHPSSYKLLRHRGHRLISTRQFAAAERDLARAAELLEGEPDAPEPDGMPNAAGIPRSTNHSNIWYHLGLARWLLGDFSGARSAYARGLEVARANDDMLVAMLYWYHMTLERLGESDRAAAVLESVRDEMDILENRAYHELLLMFAGRRTPDEVLRGHAPGSVEHATRAFGVGMHALFADDLQRAREEWTRIVESTDPPAAFGFIAAEAELGR